MPRTLPPGGAADGSGPHKLWVEGLCARVSTLTLLLFDIDGTLVRTRPLTHQQALARAAVEVFGLPRRTDAAAVRAVEPWGKTDRWILRELLGYQPDDEAIARWEHAACVAYEQLEHGEPSDDDRRTAAVLARAADAGHELALVTGNLEPIARRKLDLRGLGQWFPRGRGGFGSDAESRADLVRIALDRAGARPASDAVLIGDTPLDVAAAIEAGVRCIGVAGGRYSREHLVAAGADSAVDDLDELDALL